MKTGAYKKLRGLWRSEEEKRTIWVRENYQIRDE